MDEIQATVDAFLRARKSGQSIKAFPVAQPATLADAYKVQERILSSYSSAPVGWKVAAIRPELKQTLGADRLVGPIVSLLELGSDTIVNIPVIV